MIQMDDSIEKDNQFRCEVLDLQKQLQEINQQDKSVILLVDELNKLGIPLDIEVSKFLIDNFLDQKGRYLILSSHVLYHIDGVLDKSLAASDVITLA